MRWEVGFAHLPTADERQVLIGQNFSPAISPDEMFNAVLRYGARTSQGYDPVALFLHRITPARQTLDYGKIPPRASATARRLAVREALEKIAAPWIKRRNAEMRGKKPPRLPDEPKPERITIKDAVRQGPAGMLRVRDLVRRLPDDAAPALLRRAPQGPGAHRPDRSSAMGTSRPTCCRGSSRTIPSSTGAGASTTRRAAPCESLTQVAGFRSGPPRSPDYRRAWTNGVDLDASPTPCPSGRPVPMVRTTATRR